MHRILPQPSYSGKFSELGKLSMIHQTKTIQISILMIDNLLADLFIHQSFPHRMLKKSKSPSFVSYSMYTLFSQRHKNYVLAKYVRMYCRLRLLFCIINVYTQ